MISFWKDRKSGWVRLSHLVFLPERSLSMEEVKSYFLRYITSEEIEVETLLERIVKDGGMVTVELLSSGCDIGDIFHITLPVFESESI